MRIAAWWMQRFRVVPRRCHLPEHPGTVVIAVPHQGLRFCLARELLARGIHAALVRDGDSAVRLLGRSPKLAYRPIAVVVMCRSVATVRALVERLSRLRCPPARLLLVDPPDEVRRLAHRHGARVTDSAGSLAALQAIGAAA